MRAVDESWIRVVAQLTDVHAAQDVEHAESAESGVAALVVRHGRTARTFARVHVVQAGGIRPHTVTSLDPLNVGGGVAKNGSISASAINCLYIFNCFLNG